MTVREYLEVSELIRYPDKVGIKFINKENQILDIIEFDWDQAHTLGKDLTFRQIENIGNREYNIICIVENMNNIHY